MPLPYLITFRDAIDYVTDYLGGQTEVQEYSHVRRSVYDALRNMAYERDWRYYRRHGRINLNADFSDGTVAYDHTGGSSERLVTWTADEESALPSWARSGRILFEDDDVEYLVESRLGDTTLQLDATLCPQADVAAASTFTLYRTIYPLPGDFWKMWEVQDESGCFGNGYISPEEWLELSRHSQTATSAGFHWTLIGDPNLYGSRCIATYGYTDAADTLDFMFQAMPRALKYSGVDSSVDYAGTVTGSAGSATITGSGTAFSSDMEGSIMRFSSTSATQVPTGLEGLYPYAEQRVIESVASTTSLTLASTLSNTYSGKAYVISDPIDVPEYLIDLFYAGLEKNVSRRMSPDKWAIARDRYKSVLYDAQERDSDIPLQSIRGQFVFKLPSWARVVN